MFIVDRIISREISGKIVQSGVWLLGVYEFVAFLELLEHESTDNRFAYIIQSLLLSIPRMLYELSPMILLVGTVMALAILSRNSELVAMQAAGISKYRITGSVVAYAFVFGLVIFALGESVVPLSETKSQQLQNIHTSKESTVTKNRNVWFRDQNRFIHVGDFVSEEALNEITIYHFDSEGYLVRRTQAENGIVNDESSTLMLRTVEHDLFENGIIQTRQVDSEDYPISVEWEIIDSLERDSAQLTVWQLYESVQFQKENGLKAGIFSLALWNRFIIPLSLLTMAVFGVLFTFPKRRGLGMGNFVFIGLLFGLVYFAIQQTVGYVVVLNDYSPILGTLSVFVVFSVGAAVAIYRL